MSRSRRLFAAIAPDDSTRSIVAQHLSSHVPDGLPGKVVAPDNWHLTLRFFGSVSEPNSERLRYELDRSELGAGFELRLARLGAFPRAERATVLWLGIDRGGDRLADLAGVCDQAGVAAGLEPEERPFHGHMTLARIRPHQDVTDLVTSVPAVAVSLQVREFVLFESRLSGGGARYEVVDRFPL